MTDQPQLYLVSPPEIDLETFVPRLEACLDAVPVACLRLDLATRDEDAIARAADTLREIAHARDIPLVITDHWLLAERLGLDGVHLSDGPRQVRKARKALPEDAIVGAFCGTSRHDGMTAGEAGADYVAFGPAGETALGGGARAEAEMFGWWSEMIELPVVAEGALDPVTLRALAPVTDFFSLREEIWGEADPAAALRGIYDALT
ncbi:thiamine phosphate synthase [Pseudoroseicyclus aestuarii]|uniref:Thiamine-phosphate pyrophosphorylase n=1 Tax=Pseudoroseicyclus aestuarii TaxID=1795041 RepID=A0A318SXJ6_9RHOB|nr:thiamine phosphate synthase [Pseudoroseicyclus aestuarii]PYE86075.1 thiamine-phosphate pyrophosphorylase [Pseudoroseicyclus aestuarii]